MPWAVLCRYSDLCLDGAHEKLAGNGYFGRVDAHPCRTALFETRSAARAAIQKHFGRQHHRRDLCSAPHGWLAPIAVRVAVEVRRLP